GAGGYIAVRHLKAIKETGNQLVCALDKNDSVGILDSYFPDARFFVEFERFDRHVDKIAGDASTKVDYVSICSPNYLHDAHIRFALRNRADAICEKPLVLNPWNVEALMRDEERYPNHIYTILQLRLHPAIVALKKRIDEGPADRVYDIDLNYITSRGNWYHASWKADLTKSGGIATNIGVHFFDMLAWIFGDVEQNIVHLHTDSRAAGFLLLKRARVRWFLSINSEDLPGTRDQKAIRTHRSIRIDGEEVEFSDGFTELHTKSYEEILAGKGFGVDETATSINIVHQIRNRVPLGLKGDYHPMLKKIGI
ncbi:MAG: Gfo/Idh/MocA family oxidoreductase, partial [Bacteroidales bacterium]